MLMGLLMSVHVFASEDLPTLPDRPSTGQPPELPDPTVRRENFAFMKPLDVPIIQGGKLRGYLGLTLTIEVSSRADAQVVKDVFPRLRDRMLTDLWGVYYLLWRPGFMPNIDMIKRRLDRSMDEVLDGNLVKHVYAKEFYFRPSPTYSHTSY